MSTHTVGAAMPNPSASPLKIANAPTADVFGTSMRRYARTGFLTLLLLIGGFGGWAATTDLSGAVLASGVVVVAGNVKKVQHPTGGVVGELLVKNGDRVKANDLLVRLDETVTRASMQLVTKQIDELLGREARLLAESTDSPAIVIPADLVARKTEDAISQIISGETALFKSRVSTRSSQKEQLGERSAGLREEISGTEKQVEAKGREISLIAKELEGLEVLERQKLVPTSKMMALRREAARLDGERAQLLSNIGQARGKIAEIELQRLGIDSEAKTEIVRDLRETQGKLIELYERRTAAEDQLKRIEIRSPADGIVHQMSVFTIGGVVNTAEPLMLIVPEHDKLVIDARIAPQDIDQARAHDNAKIRFPAFNQRTTPMLEGHIKTISADLTTDQKSGVSYYVARLEIDEDEREKLSHLKLIPGMPAEIQIRTDSRSALSYLVKPLEDHFSKAFKER